MSLNLCSNLFCFNLSSYLGLDTIDDAADMIEDYLYGHELNDNEVQDIVRYCPNCDDAEEYAVKNHHTVPNANAYRFPTLQQMRRAVKCLRKAAVYAYHIDWLLTGNETEEDFMNQLIADLKAVSQGRQVDYSK